MSYTYATMEVSKQTFEEVKGKLVAAGYEHSLHHDGEVLSMVGVALIAEATPEREYAPGELRAEIIERNGLAPELQTSKLTDEAMRAELEEAGIGVDAVLARLAKTIADRSAKSAGPFHDYDCPVIVDGGQCDCGVAAVVLQGRDVVVEAAAREVEVCGLEVAGGRCPLSYDHGGACAFAPAEAEWFVRDVAWGILQALHKEVPKVERPMSWSEVNGEQEARLLEAAKGAIGTTIEKHMELDRILGDQPSPVEPRGDGAMAAHIVAKLAVEMSREESCLCCQAEPGQEHGGGCSVHAYQQLMEALDA